LIPRDDEISEDIIDVDALMADLRRRVAEKKARGLYSVDALMREPPPRDEPFAVEDLERLRELGVLRYDMSVNPSDKPLVGPAVTRVKGALARSTSQPGFTLAAEVSAFHAALVAYLGRLAREVTDLRNALQEAQAAAARATDGVRDVEVDHQRDLGQLEGRVEELAAEVERLRGQAAEQSREPS
jgi:hypothetical protein